MRERMRLILFCSLVRIDPNQGEGKHYYSSAGKPISRSASAMLCSICCFTS